MGKTMSRWFKHYAGMTRDTKLARVAFLTGQPLERVVWVWCEILESAAEINDDGAFNFDPDEAAHHLRCGGNDIINILDVLTELARIGDGHVTQWRHRQSRSDGSAERMRRYRARKKAGKLNENSGGSAPSHSVTVTSPVTISKKQSTEAEVEKAEKKERNTPPAAASRALELSKEGSPEDQFWELATALVPLGVPKSLSGQLLKLIGKDCAGFEIALADLRSVAKARNPQAYIGKIISDLKFEQKLDMQEFRLLHTVTAGGDEPEFVRRFRLAGYPIEKRDDGTWRIGGDVFDAGGQVIGG
jgi:hypothetical protein